MCQIRYFYAKYDKYNTEIEKMKLQLCKNSSGIGALEYAMQCVNFAKKKLYDLDNDETKFSISNSTATSIIYYASCFNTNNDLIILDKSVFSDEAKNNDPNSDQLSEREYHQLIMNYRNRILAHNLNFAGGLMDVGVVQFKEAYEVITLCTSRAPIESLNFYNAFENLINKSISALQNKNEKITKRIQMHIMDGNIVISDEEIALIPIPDIPTKKFWGLI